MNRDETIARGIEVKETQHSMKRRSPWHDYHRKGVYMLTLVIDGHTPLLGELRGDVDSPRVERSELGNAILNEEIPKINKYYPQVTVWKT